MRCKICQGSRPSQPAAMRIHPPDVDDVGIFGRLAMVADFARSTIGERVSGKLHVCDARSLQHHLTDEGFVGPACNGFDHSAEMQ